MTSARLARGVTIGLVLSVAIACGSAGTSEFDDGEGTSGPDGGGSGGGFGTFDPNAADGGRDDGGAGGDLNACAVDKQQSELAPLDLILMQDTSGSMWSYTSGTTTKWAAVKEALGTFMADPSSAGLGLGFQVFPIFDDGVPNNCAADADCGPSGGQCIYKACSVSRSLCSTNADCAGGGGICTQLQRCLAYQEAFCLTAYDCSFVGLTPATCNQPIVKGICQNSSPSCTVADYSSLAAPVAALPGAASAITAALDARIPAGQTPTHAALQGAISAAKAQVAAHPGAVAAVILSTDGIPNTRGKCTDDPDAIAAVAAAGLAGTPSIKTFVIGVLAPAEATAATATLNKIAVAGGTTSATIIGTSTSTQADFIAALQKVRGASLPCEFTLPIPQTGTPDYGKVNVQYTDPTTGNETVFSYVGSNAACDAASGGWYYDVDPKDGKPSKVVLCPASCTMVQKDSGGTVDVVQGCATRGPN